MKVNTWMDWLDEWFWTLVGFGAATLLIALALATLSGCALVPTEHEKLIKQEQRESIAASTTAQVVSAAKLQPANVEVTVQDKGGSKVTVTQPAQVQEQTQANTGASEASRSSASGAASETTTIPLGAKLILLACGLGLLLLVGWLMLRASKALRAAWTVGDEYLARGINRVRNMAQAETDPERANLLNSIVSGLENERADFNRD